MRKSILTSFSIGILLSSCGYSDRPLEERAFMNGCTLGGLSNLIDSDHERYCSCGYYWQHESGKTLYEASEICKAD